MIKTLSKVVVSLICAANGFLAAMALAFLFLASSGPTGYALIVTAGYSSVPLIQSVACLCIIWKVLRNTVAHVALIILSGLCAYQGFMGLVSAMHAVQYAVGSAQSHTVGVAMGSFLILGALAGIVAGVACLKRGER